MEDAMKDYIDILIEDLRDRLPSAAPEYVRQLDREVQAVKDLMASLNDRQKDLYLTCEEERGKADALYESGMFRQIFLLAQEIYR